MSVTRRSFVKSVAGVVALAAAGLSRLGRAEAPAAGTAPASGTPLAAPPAQRILILGGTGFLGPDVVEAARARGHVVTLFNRGKTNPHLFPDLEKLHGDRDGQLDALKDRAWDAVVDTSGYVPRVVRMSAELLAPSVKQYVFISSVSVYADNSRPGMDETTRLEELKQPDSENVREHYGALKALCEQAAEAAMPGRVTNIRPGLIVGPEDPTDRFTYWPVRTKRGGEVLAPGSGRDPVQVIDARDLGAWVVRCIEDRTVGVYNAVGPASRTTMADVLATCREAAGSDARLTWVDAKFLEEQQVAAWSDMPAWVPAEGEYAGFGSVSARKAMDRGLTFRPLLDTCRDTLSWWATLPAERQGKLRAGLAPEREAAVLQAWHARSQGSPARG
jgi:2'-hydroxyisoflavone reductase